MNCLYRPGLFKHPFMEVVVADRLDSAELLFDPELDALNKQVSELLTGPLRNRHEENLTQGILPKTAFDIRKPPLHYCVPVQCTFIDESANGLMYVQLVNDKAVFDDVMKEMASPSGGNGIHSIRRPLTLNDLCEGETLVSVSSGSGPKFRARVMHVYSETQVEVFYIDLGYTKILPLQLIEQLTATKALRIGQLAIPCRIQSRVAVELSKVKANQVFNVIFAKGHPGNGSNNNGCDGSNCNITNSSRTKSNERNVEFYCIADIQAW